MELEIYQTIFILTALFSGSYARPATSRQTAIIGLKLSAKYPRISQLQEPQEYISSRQGMLSKLLPVVEKGLQSKIDRIGVIKRHKRTGQFRRKFFFPSRVDHVSKTSKLPAVKIKQKTVGRLGGLIRQKAAAKFNKLDRAKVRRRRYVKQGSQWHHDTITWNVDCWSSKLSQNVAKTTLTKAFRLWAEVSPLQFRWLDPPASVDITVKFATGDHGDANDFDGPGRVPAHAFYPNAVLSGDIHFDDDESWTTSSVSSNGYKQLLPVAVHEIGHSLGLKHSQVSGSIMSAFYSDQNRNVILSDDDVRGIQDIYGKCSPKVTAIETWMGDDRTYIFDASNFWRLNDYGMKSDRGYPKQISSNWPGVPDNIDEIFLWGHNWKVYFFKGHQYYRYNDQAGKVDSGYPKDISQGWFGLPANGIDAGFTWSAYTSYFFKGSKVYKYDNINDQVASGYPKQITDDWPGVPNNIDSVFRWYYDGNTYFFKNEYYWAWKETTNQAMGPYLIRDHWKNICNV